MKKLLIVALAIIGFGGFSLASTQLNEAISRMNEKGLTKFDNATDFMATNGLRRDEASKFFVQYAKEVMGLTPDTSKTSCNFTDLSQARPDLKDLIKESCQLGLFQGYNGKFMPTQSLTNAQAITVLIRMIDGKKDETQGHFAQLYFEKAQELGIMNGLTLNSTTNFDKLTTRGDVGQLIYSTSKLSGTNIQSTNQNNNTTNCNSISCLLNFNNCPNECKENNIASNTGENINTNNQNTSILTCEQGYHIESAHWDTPLNERIPKKCVANSIICSQSETQHIIARLENFYPRPKAIGGVRKKNYTNNKRSDCKYYCENGFTASTYAALPKNRYFESSFQNLCLPIRECSVDNGVGSQVYIRAKENSLFEWSNCKVESCNEGFSKVEINNICRADTEINIVSCKVNNGIGEQIIQGVNRLGCNAVSCDIGFQISGSICVPIPNSSICTNGSGDKGIMYLENGVRTECNI